MVSLLGSDASAYAPDALQSTMLGHHYGLQLHLYTLGLHRFLRSRLGEAYAYEAHIGGATYAFLRGMEGNAIGDEGHASHALAEPTGASEVTASPAGPSPQSPVPSPQSLFTHRPSAALIDALDRLLSPDA